MPKKLLKVAWTRTLRRCLFVWGPVPSKIFVLGRSFNFVDSESGHIQSVKVCSTFSHRWESVNIETMRWTHLGVNFNRWKWMLWPRERKLCSLPTNYISMRLSHWFNDTEIWFCKVFWILIPPRTLNIQKAFSHFSSESPTKSWFLKKWANMSRCHAPLKRTVFQNNSLKKFWRREVWEPSNLGLN